jgi:hypothetical protein
MDKKDLIHSNVMAQDFRRAVEGKLDQEKIDAIVASLLRPTLTAEVTSAEALFAGGLFYVNVGITTSGKQVFDGNGGGLYSIGATVGYGIVTADSLSALGKNTVSFSTHISGAHNVVIFYDSGSNVLGQFQSAAGGGGLIGAGGGSGSWR